MYIIIKRCVYATGRGEKEMINTREIKAQIRRVGTTQEELAKKLGINASTLNRKINNEEGQYLTVKEATEMVRVLEIPNDQLLAIFFAVSVADKQQKAMQQ